MRNILFTTGDKIHTAAEHRDELPLRPLRCTFSASRHSIYEPINDVIKRTFNATVFSSQFDPLIYGRGDGKWNTVFLVARDNSLICDATCYQTRSPTTIVSSAVVFIVVEEVTAPTVFSKLLQKCHKNHHSVGELPVVKSMEDQVLPSI